MPKCRNCNGFVTENYVRVFTLPNVEGVWVCPNCEDELRGGEEVCDARSPRH